MCSSRISSRYIIGNNESVDAENFPLVYIIILNWNGKEDALECLCSVQEVDYPRYQVLVVDNASDDGSPEVIRAAFPAVELIVNESNLGFAAGNNVGIEYALQRGADYVFLLNNDTIVDRMALAELVKACEADPAVGLASPKVYYYDRPNTIYYAGARRHWLPLLPNLFGVGEADRGQYEKVEEVDYVWGQAMFIKRRVIEDIGLLDSSFFMYYEDCDYCLRTIEAGHKIVYVPKAIMWHKIAKGTEGDYLTRWQYKVKGMLHFHRKHSRLGLPQAVLLTIATLTWITVRELWRGNWRPLPQMVRSFIQRHSKAQGLKA